MAAEPDTLLIRLHDLHRQATERRSHYYVGACVRAAIEEISRLRAEDTLLRREIVVLRQMIDAALQLARTK